MGQLDTNINDIDDTTVAREAVDDTVLAHTS